MTVSKVLFYGSALAIGGIIGVLLGLVQIQADQKEQDMTELVEGYEVCLQAENRTSQCFLEYDGDGSSNTPKDWHWYWKGGEN